MRLLAVLLLAAPLLARAQAAPQAPAPAEWSLGAGVAVAFTSQPLSAIVATNRVTAPLVSVAASLERRVGERSWLVVGALGSASSYRQDVPAGDFGFERDSFGYLSVQCGGRFPVTRPGAPLEVSVLAAADLGAGWRSSRLVSIGGLLPGQKARTWLVGAELGLAVERELTSGLALRVASPLATLFWSQSRSEVEGAPTISGRSFTAGLLLAPRLELRLFF